MFILNSIVLLTIVLLACKNGRTQTSFLFMANLALADATVFICLLVLSFITSNWAATTSEFVVCWEQPSVFATRCSMEMGVLSFCLYSSLVCLSFLTVDRSALEGCLVHLFKLLIMFRYIFITRPLHYRTIMTTKKVIKFLPLCWLIAVIWSCLSLQGLQFIPENICSLEHALSPSYLIIFSVLVTIPFFIAIGVYSIILNTYRRRQARLWQQEKEMTEEYHFKAVLTFNRKGRKVLVKDSLQEKWVYLI